MSKIQSNVPESQIAKVFFQNLDGLRFYCFLLVFLFHSYKIVFVYIRNRPEYFIFEFLFRSGEVGVNIFFVLSGFLITYLLITEKLLRGTISLKNFYLRRILRIWPLFYICLVIGFIFFPLIKYFLKQDYNEIANPIMYLFFLNNFDYIKGWPNFPDALSLIVLWSIAVEEQFYLLWPIILKYVAIRFYIPIFLLLILGTIVFRSLHLSDSSFDFAVRNFHTFSVIGDMAIGGIFAVLSTSSFHFKKWIQNLSKNAIIFIYALIAVIYFGKEYLFDSPVMLLFERLIFGLGFGLIIIEQNFANNSFFKFSNYLRISKVGNYTYGLYCLHFLVLSIVLNTFIQFMGTPENMYSCIVIVILSFYITNLLAKFSFSRIEKPFLNMKEKITYIKKI